MGWKAIHRWLGLTIGSLALVLGTTGAILAFDPVQQAWQAPAAPDDLAVATLVARVTHTVPGAQEIRRLPSGAIVVFSFAGDEALASYIDPADGRVLGPWQPSALPRWVKNLHRSLLLGDAGRWGAARIAMGMGMGMGLLSVSGLVLLMRRMGGWRRLATRVRGTLAQRTHVVMGRVVLAVLLLTSITALTMSASTLGLVAPEAGPEPDVVSAVPVVAAGTGQAALPGEQPVMPLSMSAQNLRKLNIPDPTDPEDTWKVATDQGQAWIDRYSGQPLAWQGNTLAQRIYDWALVLHTGEGAWAWAVVLGLVGACVLVFWASGSPCGGRRAAWHRTSRATAPWHRPTYSSSSPARAEAPGVLPRRCKTRCAKAATRCTPAHWSIFRPRLLHGRCLFWPQPMAMASPRPTPATPWNTSPSSALGHRRYP